MLNRRHPTTTNAPAINIAVNTNDTPANTNASSIAFVLRIPHVSFQTTK
jgi:hypothetical protein